MLNGVGVLRDQFLRVLLGGVIFAVGAVVLLWPSQLDATDRFGYHISCGSGLVGDYEQATRAAADEDMPSASPPTKRPPEVTSTDYVRRCRVAVWHRRLYAIALMVIGGACSAVAAVQRIHRSLNARVHAADHTAAVRHDRNTTADPQATQGVRPAAGGSDGLRGRPINEMR